jgi:hypothetical protein
MTEPDPAETQELAALAALFGVVIQREHFAEVVQAWRLMAPHRARVATSDLASVDEPAALFRP